MRYKEKYKKAASAVAVVAQKAVAVVEAIFKKKASVLKHHTFILNSLLKISFSVRYKENYKNTALAVGVVAVGSSGGSRSNI